MWFVYLYILGLVVLGVLHLLLPWKHHLPLLLQSLFDHGKQRQSHIVHFSIPKSWFRYFYLWGFIWNSYIISSVVISSVYPVESIYHFPLHISSNVVFSAQFKLPHQLTSSSDNVPPVDVLLVLVMMWCHLLRRIYESFFITQFGDSTMHLVHFMYAIFFYTTLMVFPIYPLITNGGNNDGHVIVTWSFRLLGLVLFLWGSYHQYICHVILANIKKNRCHGNGLVGKYAIPRGDWFNYVSCPHFLSEILIYASFYLFGGFTNNPHLLLPLVSTVLMLTNSARNSHSWYLRKFPAYPKDRFIIIPQIY